MSTHVEEPPMLAAPPGQLREWVQLALLLADMIARRRERLGREAWSEERAAERALERAERARSMRLATREEQARHRVGGRWEVGGRGAGDLQASVTTALGRVGERWVLHAIGHRGEPVGDIEAWLSCPTREHAVRVATALLGRNDPERVARLRDELEATDERDRRQDARRRASHAGDVGTERDPGGGDAADEPWSRDEKQAAVSAMETELRGVFDRASANAVTNDPRWASVVREMLDAQAEGHDLGELLTEVRSRLRQPLSNRSYYRSPAAYLFALFRKERDIAERAAAGEHIDMPPPSDAGAAHADEPAPDAVRAQENGDGAVVDAFLEADRDQAASNQARTNRSATAEGVLEWIDGLDSESDLDRMLAEDTVGRYGREVDEALGERFPGLLSPHRARPASEAARSTESPIVVALSGEAGRDAQPGLGQEASADRSDAQRWRSREGDDLRDLEAADPVEAARPGDREAPAADTPMPGMARTGSDTVEDAHRAAAEHAAALEAEGHEGAAVARAAVSATPSHDANPATAQQVTPNQGPDLRGATERRRPGSIVAALAGDSVVPGRRPRSR